MAMRRIKYLSMSVDIDMDDALAEITTDDLAAELASRGVSGHLEVVATAIAQIRRGDTLDAITTLEREFWPKWQSVADSEAAFRGALASTAVEAALANDNQEVAA